MYDFNSYNSLNMILYIYLSYRYWELLIWLGHKYINDAFFDRGPQLSECMFNHFSEKVSKYWTMLCAWSRYSGFLATIICGDQYKLVHEMVILKYSWTVSRHLSEFINFSDLFSFTKSSMIIRIGPALILSLSLYIYIYIYIYIL